MTPSIHILTPSLMPYDAIGNDVVQMRIALQRNGYDVRIFADAVHPAYASIAETLDAASKDIFTSPENVLIYHHSMGWSSGEQVLSTTRNRIILRHHNITPAHFFAPYSLAHVQACESGVEATRRIARLSNMLILGDSTYNCKELIAHGANPRRCRVLAPLHLTADLGRESFDLATSLAYSGATANILFVGGVKPNKGHARAIRVFEQYHRNFNSDSRLIFAGALDERLRGYLEDLKALAAELGIADCISFTGSVTSAQLKSLYVSADVFLCTSEHEGFCVPLLEAMYFRLPIVAWGITAVPETMGDCSFLLDDWDEREFARRIDLIVSDQDKSESLGAEGRDRYRSAFAPEVLREKLCTLMAEVTQ